MVGTRLISIGHKLYPIGGCIDGLLVHARVFISGSRVPASATFMSHSVEALGKDNFMVC